jgi:hypothetical protein
MCLGAMDMMSMEIHANCLALLLDWAYWAATHMKSLRTTMWRWICRRTDRRPHCQFSEEM